MATFRIRGSESAVFVQGAGTGLQRPGIPAAAVPVTAAESVLFRGEIPANGVGDDIGEDQVVVRRGVPHDVAFGTPEVTGIAPDGTLAGDMFVAPGREAAEIAAVAFLLFEGFLLAPHFVADRNFGEGTGEGFAAERRSRIGRSRERRDGDACSRWVRNSEAESVCCAKAAPVAASPVAANSMVRRIPIIGRHRRSRTPRFRTRANRLRRIPHRGATPPAHRPSPAACAIRRWI